MSRSVRPCQGLALLLSVAFLLPCPARAQQPTGARHALLIGIKEYTAKGLDELRFTENDVEDLAAVLKKGGFTSVRVLTTTRGKQNKADAPNAANIRAAIKALLANKKRTETILIGLSGHGVTVNMESCFCPSDAKTEDIKTLISMKQLVHDIDDCGAGVNLLLVDACRNDPKQGRSVDAGTLPRLPRGTAALFSCMNGERSFETDKLPGGRGHGIFFHHVLQGLRGEAKNNRGEITWDRLAEHVKEQVSDDVPKIVGGGARQTPELNAVLTGKSPVIMKAVSIEITPPPPPPPPITKNKPAELFRKAQALHFGQGQKIDFAEAAKLYSQAAAAGSQPAGAFLGLLLATGAGGTHDEAKARQLCAAAAKWARPEANKKNNPTAQVLLGQMHERGLGVPKNEKMAADFYSKAADKGDVVAETYLANLVANGKGRPKDEAKAVKLYSHAADKGLALAQNGLGMMHLSGRGVPRKPAEAARLIYKASEQGLPLAQSNLGFLCSTGQGVKRNDAEAVRLYRLASEKNEPWGHMNLGFMHAEGRGVEKNDAEAVRLYRKAADLGLPQAQHKVGVAYFIGQGTAKDEKEAATWFRKAADQDLTDSQTQLGMMFMLGLGIDKNEVEGARLLRKAAEKGHPSAQFLLGVMYEQGDGVPKDTNEARKWYEKAAAQGNAQAKERLEKLKL